MSASPIKAPARRVSTDPPEQSVLHARNDAQTTSPVPAVVLSGGSEVVSVALVEALATQGIPLLLIRLGRGSLLRDSAPSLTYRELSWPPVSLDSALEQLLKLLTEMGAGEPCPWPAFATEDGGLRLLLEGRQELETRLAIPGAGALKLGGLDKAELFEHLAKVRPAGATMPALVLTAPDQAREAFERLGPDAVFKPALKPWSMDLSPLGRRNVKIISAAPGEHTSDVARRLDAAWPLSTRWVAQPRLTSPPQGEAVWWGFRGADGRAWGALAFERWKYPRAGGTGCWVEIANDPQLNEQGTKLLALLRFRGTCELPFLQDSEGNWQLLELNPRPWLQVGLAERAGLPVVYATYLDMLEVAAEAFSQPLRPMGWVSPERLLAAALSGEYGPRHRAMAQALAILARAECRVPYDSPQPGVRRRWVGMLIEKGLRNWLG